MGNGSNINLIAVYLDDLLIACSDLNELNLINSQISERVPVVDKGPAKHFLSIEIERETEHKTHTQCKKQLNLCPNI